MSAARMDTVGLTDEEIGQELMRVSGSKPGEPADYAAVGRRALELLLNDRDAIVDISEPRPHTTQTQ